MLKMRKVEAIAIKCHRNKERVCHNVDNKQMLVCDIGIMMTRL